MASGRQSKKLIGNSDAMKKVLKGIEQVYKYKTTVLLLGETGTGKSLIARLIHDKWMNCKNNSSNSGEFVTLNCSAVPETLIESELFGHVKGAFTGADKEKRGVFERADHGTVFLDEIGEIKSEIQVKLLNVLDGETFTRLGGNKTIEFKGRLVCATNKNLEEAVKDNEFRKDLYQRIKVYPIKVPPLRKRKQDIPLLLDHLLKKIIDYNNFPHNHDTVKQAIENDAKRLRGLLYDWSGNVRELEKIAEKALINSQDDENKFLGHFYAVIEQEMAQKTYSPKLQSQLSEYMHDILKSILANTPGCPDSLNESVHEMMGSALSDALEQIISSGATNLPDNPTAWGKILGHTGLAGGKGQAGLGKTITYKYIRDAFALLYNNYQDARESLKNTLGEGMYNLVEEAVKSKIIQSGSTTLMLDDEQKES